MKDINGDGVADFVIATSDGSNKVIYGAKDGNDKDSLPKLPAADVGGPGSSQTVDVYDVDGDGDMDTVFGNTDQTASTYYKDGSGKFIEAPNLSDPVGTAYEPEPPVTTAAGTLTSDGTAGMVTNGEVFSYDEDAGWVKVDDLLEFDTMATKDVEMADVNGDGLDDIVVVTENGTPNVVYINDGTGRFPDPPTKIGSQKGALSKEAEDVEVVDVNGDGVMDIVVANSDGPSQIFYGDSASPGDYSGVAGTPIPGTEDEDASSIDLGDLDGDGDVDIVLGVVGGPNKAYINNGDGTFTEVPLGPSNDKSATQDVEMVDVDGDDIPDVVIANSDGPDRVILTSTFGGSPLGPDELATAGVVLGSEVLNSRDIEVEDLNGDGIADFVIATSDGSNKVIYNGGASSPEDLATFPAVDVGGPQSSQTVEVLDVDGDGDMDTVFGNTDQTASTYYNDLAEVGDLLGGSLVQPPGKSAPVGTAYEPEPPATTSVGKLKADGTVGMVTGGVLYEWDVIPGMEADDFKGWVEVGPLSGFVTRDTTSVTFADVDGDGDDDLIVTMGAGKPSVVYENVDGRFPDPPTPIGSETYDAQDVAVVDINGDGAVDFVIGNSDGPDLIYYGWGDPPAVKALVGSFVEPGWRLHGRDPGQ